jgi:hypothetical protein
LSDIVGPDAAGSPGDMFDYEEEYKKILKFTVRINNFLL